MPHFARVGTIASETVTVEEGPLVTPHGALTPTPCFPTSPHSLPLSPPPTPLAIFGTLSPNSAGPPDPFPTHPPPTRSLPAPLPTGLTLPHTMEPFLRKNGLPCKLNKGVIEVLGEHIVCKEGEELTAAAVAILKVFDYKLATFKVRIGYDWSLFAIIASVRMVSPVFLFFCRPFYQFPAHTRSL